MKKVQLLFLYQKQKNVSAEWDFSLEGKLEKVLKLWKSRLTREIKFVSIDEFATLKLVMQIFFYRAYCVVTLLLFGKLSFEFILFHQLQSSSSLDWNNIKFFFLSLKHEIVVSIWNMTWILFFYFAIEYTQKERRLA